MTSHAVHAWWATRAPREKNMLRACAGIVALALLWTLGLAPARRSLQQAQQQGPVLQAQRAAMASLQTEARTLQALPTHSRAVALQALQSVSTRQLGAQVTVTAQGPHAVVSFQGASPEALAQWLGQVRADARLTPDQVQWRRSANGWQGSAQFALPAN